MTEKAEFKKVIEVLRSCHDRRDFLCGNPRIDRFFTAEFQTILALWGTPFVLVRPVNDPLAMGFYCLSNFAVVLADLPTEIQNKLPRFPLVATTLLSYIGVDKRYQERRLGECLLIDALVRSLNASKEISSSAVIVDAIDNDAVKFYGLYGFRQFPEQATRIFIPMQTIRSSFV